MTAGVSMDHAERARALFRLGYNCAQSVFCAFCEDMGMDVGTAARLSSSFGGGMGRLREVCGAVSGAELALGFLRGYSDPGNPEQKSAHYRRVRDLAERFREANGTIICRELLKDVKTTPGGEPEKRTPEYYASRPCLRLVGEAAAILEQMLAESGPEPGPEPARKLSYEAAAAAIPPGRYHHFKGRDYQVLGVARHSETEEPMVVYRPLYGEGGLWVRPADMWNETVERDGKRFRRFTPAEGGQE